MALLLVAMVTLTIMLPMGAFATTDDVSAGDAVSQVEPGAGTDIATEPSDTPEGTGDALTTAGAGEEGLVSPSLEYAVSLYGADGSLLSLQSAEAGKLMAEPEDPAASADSRFVGWFEQDAEEPFEFGETLVTGELRLYARFEAAGESTDGNGGEDANPPSGEDKLETSDETQPEQPDESEEESDTHTVTFIVDGETWHSAEVQNETLVALPADPAGDAPFVGWFTEDGAPFNKKQLITEDLTLTAKFGDENVLVTYLDTDGSVLEVLEGEIGQPAPETSRTVTLGMGQSFSHWALAGESEAFTGNLTENITLVPVLNDIVLAVFVTGGSEINPQSGPSTGFTVEEPTEIPSRNGYSFTGWYADEDGTETFDFNTPITATTFIYAGWETAETGYTVNIWVEKANRAGTPIPGDNGAYDLQYTAAATGTTGDEVNLDDTAARAVASGAIQSVKELLTYSTFQKSETKTLSSNGDTVVNVYFKRTEFTFNFDVAKNTANQIVNGEIFTSTGSKGSTYSLTVKVEQDVTDLWPTSVVFQNANNQLVNWSGYYGNNASRVSFSYISVAFSSTNLSGENPRVTSFGSLNYDITKVMRTAVTIVPQTTTDAYTEVRYYWTELSAAELEQYEADGATGTLNGAEVREWNSGSHATYGGIRYYKLTVKSQVNYQSSNPASSASGWPGRDIEGFETIGAAGKGYTCQTTNFQKVEAINDGQKKNNVARNYIINYYMPRKNNTLTLVTAGGNLVDPDGTFAGTGGTYTATVRYGEEIDSLLPEVVQDKYIFDGWYTDAARTELYTGGTMPSSNLTLYSKLTGTEVTVTYSDGETVAVRTYEYGHVLTAHDLAGTLYEGAVDGTFVDGRGTFGGWYYEVGSGAARATVAFPLGLELTRESYLLTARFNPGSYLVTFVSDNGSGNAEIDRQEVKAGALNTLARSGHTALVPEAREGYAFKGWSTTDGGRVDFNTATRITENTTVYAVWEQLKITLTFDGNGGTISSDPTEFTLFYGESANDGGVTVPGAGDLTREGYTFTGWTTEAGGGTEFDPAAALKADTTVYARWEQIKVNLTFDANGGTTTPDPMRLTLLYGESVSGNNLAVPGAETVTRAGYAFTGWTTEAEGGTEFDFATILKTDTTVYAQWEQLEVTLTFEGNGGTVTPDPTQYTLLYGESVSGNNLAVPGADAVTREKYTFTGWYTEAEGGTEFDFATALETDTTVYAHWSANTTTTPTNPKPDPDPDPDPDPILPAVDPDPDPDPAPVLPIVTEPEGETLEVFPNDPVAQAQIDAQTGNPVADIADGNVPAGSLGVQGAWSLLSLMMAVAGVVISIPLAITLFRRKKRDEAVDENGRAIPAEGEEQPEEKRRSRLLKVLAIVAGLLAAILFLILDNLSLPMVFINQWTLWVAIPFIAQLALTVIQFFAKRKVDDDNEAEAEA